MKEQTKTAVPARTEEWVIEIAREGQWIVHSTGWTKQDAQGIVRAAQAQMTMPIRARRVRVEGVSAMAWAKIWQDAVERCN